VSAQSAMLMTRSRDEHANGAFWSRSFSVTRLQAAASGRSRGYMLANGALRAHKSAALCRHRRPFCFRMCVAFAHTCLASSDVANLGKLGMLKDLLQWHIDDPVDVQELIRNTGVCERYQGNRNIFIDHPELVADVFMDYPLNCAGDSPTPVPDDPVTQQPTALPTASPSAKATDPPPVDPVDPPAPDDVCASLAPGAIMPIAYSSDNPDEMIFVPLSKLPGNLKFYVTDNAYDKTTTSLASNEGIESFVVPEEGIEAGTLIRYGEVDDWEKETGDLALANGGDAVLVYCVDLEGDKRFISGISVTSDFADFPEEIVADAAIFLPKMMHYHYTGTRTGTKGELMAMIATPSNWMGSSIEKFDPLTILDDNWEVTISGGAGIVDDDNTIFTAMLAGIVGILFAVVMGCVAYLICCKKTDKGGNKPPSRFEMEVRGHKAAQGRQNKRPTRQGVDLNKAVGNAQNWKKSHLHGGGLV